MDWQAAIERQGAALRMIVAGLVAMVGAGTDPAADAAALAEERPTLARFRHRALLRIVRPAEAAARRLVIALALAVQAIPSAQAPGGSQAALPPAPAFVMKRRARRPHGPHPLRLPLTDPERRLRARRVAERDLPRITVPGVVEPLRPRNLPLPAPQDRLDATCLVLRIRALASALDDMDGEVLRFRRWKARNAAALARSRLADRARTTPARRRQAFGRISPLRHGRPPGGRRKPTHDVHSILVEAHALAFWALESPDTS
ncbi:hypothetical protein [Aquibium oceanicum]|nr:hypothetical protein [Aquibium oceanicum]